jgi:alpha-1,6-mannosyltransferase
MGAEPARFSPANRDESLRARLLAACELPPAASLLLGVGRLAPEKRWPLVVDAVNAAAASKPIGLVLFGEGREHRSLLNDIAGNPHVRLFAPERDRDRFARIVASADGLIHGCEAETFCMAAAEARASGTPVIVPDEGGAADHALNGGGLTYKAGDAASAARAIGQLLSGAPQAAAPARTIDGHFAELFALYAARKRNIAAAA